MIAFALRGTIADIDETTEDEPGHPAVLIIAVGDTFARVVVPESVLYGKRELLCAGRPVEVLGEVKDSRNGPHHIATKLRLVGAGH